MLKRLAVPAALLCACTTSSLDLLPPPFGPDGPGPGQFFFPTGMAVTTDGTLLVASGNYDQTYASGTVQSVSKTYLDERFIARLDCDQLNADPACDQKNTQIGFVPGGAVMIGNYAGPLVLDNAGTTAYTGSRDTGKLNAVSVGAGGTLSCAPKAGTGTDCRQGLIDLRAAANLDGPFAIIRGDTIAPGQSTPEPVFYVSSVVPHVDSVVSGVLQTSSNLVALDMTNPTNVVFTTPLSNYIFANGTAVGPIVFDAARRFLYASGCYQRFLSGGAGEPGSGFCSGIYNNYLRIVDVDAQASAQTSFVDLYDDVQSTNTTDLLLADPDASGAPTTLWATMSAPDVLARIQLPPQPSIPPRVRQVVPLPITPLVVTRVPRTSGGPDLLAISAQRAGAVAIYDTATDEVVAQVERLGTSPFGVVQVPCPSTPDNSFATSACLAATVFNSCSVALIEVPTDAPWNAKLRARLGSCP